MRRTPTPARCCSCAPRRPGAAALLAAHARSVEAEYLLRTDWATEVVAPRDVVRRRISVGLTGDTDHDLARDPGARSARLPSEALTLLREAVEHGPVLVQTPRAGYATRLACDRCRTPAVCTVCHGPLRLRGPARAAAVRLVRDRRRPAGAAPSAGDRACAPRCSATPARPRSSVAPFPVSRCAPPPRATGSWPTVDDTPAIVVATPGAEPVAVGGYAAVLLMDTWLLLARSDLRATEEAVRRWANAAALVRPASDGGRVLAIGDAGHPGLQALVRWDPSGLARREIEERQSAHLPPASRVATITGEPDDLEQAVAALSLPAGAEVLGPVPVDDVRGDPRTSPRSATSSGCPASSGADLSAALGALQAQRSTRKLPHVRVEVDPAELG